MEPYGSAKDRINQRIQEAYANLDKFYAEHGEEIRRGPRKRPIRDDAPPILEPLTEDIEAPIETFSPPVEVPMVVPKRKPPRKIPKKRVKKSIFKKAVTLLKKKRGKKKCK